MRWISSVSFASINCLPHARKLLRVGARRAIRRFGDQFASDQRGRGDVRRVDAALEIVAPREEVIDPRRHGVTVASQALDRKLAAPAVVHRERHRHFAPVGFVLVAVAEHACERIVAVGENVGFDDHRIADDAFRREAAAVDFGQHAIDHGAQRGRRRGCGARRATRLSSCEASSVHA